MTAPFDRPHTGERIRGGFPHQRLVVIPANILNRCRALPMVRQLYVTHIGTFSAAPHHYVERREGVEQTILIYCLAGAGSVQIAGTSFPIKKGHVVLIPPGTPHTYSAGASDPWSIFWIHFEGREGASALKNIRGDVGRPLLYVPDVPMMRQSFEEILACLNYHYSDAGLLAMTSELTHLLSKIKLHHSNLYRERKAVEDRVLGTIDFMQQHLDMLLSLEDLATYAGQSVANYGKRFKYRTGQSPMACFIQLKIRKACELLDQTNQSVKAIAAQLGYADPYYFSRLFKKIQGCSPIHYRKSIKG